MREVDIAIIGAGIAGASLAWRLAPQRSVLLLERETQPGYHSTGRSAAMFMESYGPPAVRALTRASRDFYLHPPEGFADGPLLAPRGVLYLATHEQAALMQKSRKELLPGCPDLETLDAAATLARVSCLRPEVVHGALYDPHAQDIDVHALHQGFLRGMRRQGGELRSGITIEAAAFVQGGWELRLADGEVLRAHTVVDAAGAWADEVARLFGASPIDLVPHRRTAFTFKPPEGQDVSHWPCRGGRRRKLLLQARCRPAARFARQCRPHRAARRAARGTRRGHGHPPDRVCDHAEHPPSDQHLGRAALPRARW
jgi:D-arginine dehydrogenase